MKIIWAGQNFELLSQRALLWSDKSVLIFSDVHLGKAHDFQAQGIPVPASVHDEDIERMAGLLSAHTPKRVLVLGDFVHSHRTNLDDLIFTFQEMKKAFTARWTLALGNHDWKAREKLTQWGFEQIVVELQEEGIVFSHDPGEQHEYAVSGHVHPVIRLGQGRDRMRLPCFVVGEHRLVLPSFGSFTGGFEIKPKPKDRIFVAAHNQIVSL